MCFLGYLGGVHVDTLGFTGGKRRFGLDHLRKWPHQPEQELSGSRMPESQGVRKLIFNKKDESFFEISTLLLLKSSLSFIQKMRAVWTIRYTTVLGAGR